MATERWTDEMLDRLVSTVGSLATATAQNTANISRVSEDVAQLVNTVTLHQQSLEGIWTEIQGSRTEMHGMQTEIRDMQVEIRDMQVEIRELRIDTREMQSEVRGLQTENRRILDQLINREQGGQGDP